MARSFNELRAKMTHAQREKSREQAQAMLIEIALQELRHSLGLTQEQVAQALDIKQSSLSKLENQDDMYITTLIRLIHALGGRLKLVASFPDREVLLNQFEK